MARRYKDAREAASAPRRRARGGRARRPAHMGSADAGATVVRADRSPKLARAIAPSVRAPAVESPAPRRDYRGVYSLSAVPLPCRSWFKPSSTTCVPSVLEVRLTASDKERIARSNAKVGGWLATRAKRSHEKVDAKLAMLVRKPIEQRGKRFDDVGWTWCCCESAATTRDRLDRPYEDVG